MGNDDERCFGCEHGGEYPSCLKFCSRFQSNIDVDIKIKERFKMINWNERDINGMVD